MAQNQCAPMGSMVKYASPEFSLWVQAYISVSWVLGALTLGYIIPNPIDN